MTFFLLVLVAAALVVVLAGAWVAGFPPHVVFMGGFVAIKAWWRRRRGEP